MRAAVFGWLLLAASTVHAGVPQNPRFENIDTEDGLPQDTVDAMLQDRDGFLWFGTQAGLVRHDGYRFELFRGDSDQGPGIGDQFVRALWEDGQRRLWIGTRGGLFRLDAGRARVERIEPDEPAERGPGHRDIQAIVGSPGGEAVWVGTADGLQRIDLATDAIRVWHRDPGSDAGLSDDDVAALAWDAAGNLWIGTRHGLDRLAPATGRIDHFRVSPGEEDARRNTVRTLLFVPPGSLHIGTLAGLVTWTVPHDTVQPSPDPAIEGVPREDIRALARDREGAVWLGTGDSGLYRIERPGARAVRYRHRAQDPNSLASDEVVALLQDRSGTLWIGTWSGGLSRLDLASGGFERYASIEGDPATLGDSRVYGLSGDGADGVWFATIGAGVTHLDPATGRMRHYRHDPADPASLPVNRTSAVDVDAKGRVWIALETGFGQLDPASGRYRPIALGNVAPDLARGISLLAARDGTLWLGSDGGLHRYDPERGKLTTFVHDAARPESLAQGRITTLFEDRRGEVWIGTVTGLQRRDAASGSFITHRHDPARPDSLSHNRISDVFEDRAGRLWVGTAGGLNRLDGGEGAAARFRTWTRRDGLAADAIGAIGEDAAGRLWFSTTAGISRLDPSSGQVRNYSARDGLTSGSFYVKSGYTAPDGTLYFGGLNGAVSFRPDAIHENTVPPLVAITGLRVGGRGVRGASMPVGVGLDGSIEQARTLRIAPGVPEFTLEFSALHFADPARNRYAHQLVGFDRDWVETDASQRSATYTNLDPGTYQFRVKAANKDGVWNSEGATLAITVLPPWWATWWFRTLATATLVLVAIGAWRTRVSGLKHQQAMLERDVAARTAEIAAQAEKLDQARGDLAALGAIGRELTATLDQDSVIENLRAQLPKLLDASSIGLYLMDGDGSAMQSVLLVEHGQPGPVDRIELSSTTRIGARAVRERREIVVDFAPEADNPSLVPGTLHTLSALFTPLAIGERMLGLLTIQSPRRHVYGEREQQIFRTLSAYAAIALDNAAGYRRLAEADAALSRALVEQQLMFDQAASAILYLRGRIIHRCNRAMEEILGYAPGELAGQSAEIYHFSRESFERQGLMAFEAISRGQVAEGEWELKRKDGSGVWVSYHGRALDPADVAAGSVWVAQDVTERHRMALALERIQREQQLIFDNMTGGILFTRDRLVVRCNRGLEEMLGYAPGGLDGLPTRSFYVSDEDWEAFAREVYPMLQGGGVARGETEFQRLEGQRVQVLYSGRAIDPAHPDQGVVWLAQDISERKRAEAALERALHEQQILFDNMQGGILFARDRTMVRCNRGLEEVLGYEPGALVGQSLALLYGSEEALDRSAREMRPVLAAGGVAQGEIQFRHRDGSLIWVEFSGKALDPADLAQGIVWVGYDIRERKAAEDALRRVLEEQQLIWDNITGGVMLTVDRTVARCSRGAEELLGFEPGTLQGQSGRVYFPSDEVYEAFGRMAYPLLAQGKVVQSEVDYRHRDGSLIAGFVSGKAVDPADLSKGVVWVAQDIRVQKQNEQALRRALLEQQIIFDNISGSIAVVKDGVIHRCSRGFEEMFDYGPGEAVGLPVHRFYRSPEAYAAFAADTTPGIMAGKVTKGEWEYRRKDGTMGWLLYHGKAIDPTDLAQGTIWLGQDITARKQSETALIETKEQLEHTLADVEQMNRQVSLLGELTGFLQASPSAGEAYRCIGEFGPRLFPHCAGALYLLDEGAGAWLAHGRWHATGGSIVEPDASLQGDECWALRRSRAYRVDDPDHAICCPHVSARGGERHPYTCLPLVAQGKTFGLLHIAHLDRPGADEADRRHALAVSMAEQIALAIANLQLREALLEQSIRDPLTALYNRRHMQETLFRELGRGRRTQGPLALMMIDIDHFKRFNDTYGHHAGDLVLKNVARALEAQVRRGDVCCRYGGEELAVILPGADADLAQQLAHSVLDGIRALVLNVDGRRLPPITASLGLAYFPDHGQTPEALIAAADAALYRAKQGGRDRVEVSGSAGGS